MNSRLLVVIFAGALLAGCMDPVRDIKPWSRETASQASIETISISFRGVPGGDTFQTLKSAIEQRTQVCARGPKPHELRVMIDQYEYGSSDKISATVQVVDPSTQQAAAEYYIQEVRGGIGIVGVINAASRGADNARDFAKSVCRRIFYAAS